jgi:hypothetical protein
LDYGPCIEFDRKENDGRFVLPRKKKVTPQSVSKLDGFGKEIVRTVHDIYDTGKFPTPQKIIKYSRTKTNVSGFDQNIIFCNSGQ